MNDSRQCTSVKYQPPSLTKETLDQQQHDDHSSNNEKAPLRRQESDISLYNQNSPLTQFIDAEGTNDINTTPWTRKQWEVLESWYVKRDRDCQQATEAFFICESVISESKPPLWSMDYILWRCRCLDTNTKYHNGVLPSERKLLKKKLKALSKRYDHMGHKRIAQQRHQQQHQQQRKIQQQQQQQKNDPNGIDNNL